MDVLPIGQISALGEKSQANRAPDHGARAEVRQMGAPDRRALLDREGTPRSLRRQCALLGVARSGVCRRARPANDYDLALKRQLDELYTGWPFLGSRRMAAMLRG